MKDHERSETELLPALRALLTWLGEAGHPFVLIGGIAVGILARPRATKDVDALIWADEPEWPGLLQFGRKHGFTLRMKDGLEFAGRTRVLLLLHQPSGVPVDLLCGMLPFEQEIVRKGVEKTHLGLPVRVPRPEDLIVMKALANRPQDLADIAAILAAHESLDLRKIRRMTRQLAKTLEMPEIHAELERLLKRGKR